jgi:TnpA family transposase
MGRIYKTCFLLRCYDELPLRQDIEKQLNRIELSHFAHAVFFGGNQEFNYATKEEQDMALGCRQLIQNSIVLWNYLYVSEKLSEITCPVERQRQIDRLRSSSIMTWQHVNMHGRYDFNLETIQKPFDFNKVKSLTIT